MGLARAEGEGGGGGEGRPGRNAGSNPPLDAVSREGISVLGPRKRAVIKDVASVFTAHRSKADKRWAKDCSCWEEKPASAELFLCLCVHSPCVSSMSPTGQKQTGIIALNYVHRENKRKITSARTQGGEYGWPSRRCHAACRRLRRRGHSRSTRP